MVRESEIRIRTYSRHVTLGTGVATDGLLVARHYVAVPACGVISGELPFERSMRRMACEARQSAIAFPKAGADRQQQRLMPCVPRIAQIRRAARRRRHPMTGPAQIVQLI